MMSEKEIPENPILEPEEPERSAEEEMQIEIAKQSDAEQVRIYDLSLPGQPIKCIIERSQKLGKQVCCIPQYHVLKDNDKVIGYQRWGDKLSEIEDYGIMPSGTVEVIGERQRGEQL